MTKVEQQTKKTQEHLRKQKDEFQSQLDKREQCISHIQSLVERSTGAELVKAKASIDELFQGLEDPKGMVSILEGKSPIALLWETQEISQILQESTIGHFDETATEASQCSVEGFQAVVLVDLDPVRIGPPGPNPLAKILPPVQIR